MNAMRGPGIGVWWSRRWAIALLAGLLASGVCSSVSVSAQSIIDTTIAVLPIAESEIIVPALVEPVIVSEAGTTAVWSPGAGLDVLMVGDRPGRR